MTTGPERFEILEHTADVGLRAFGRDLPELFANATRALCEIAGIWQPGDGTVHGLDLESGDLGGLLVDWLSEVIFLQDSRGAAVAAVTLEEVTDRRAAGSLTLTPLREGPGEGTQVKAITYHRLKVERTGDGWIAEVFLDI